MEILKLQTTGCSVVGRHTASLCRQDWAKGGPLKMKMRLVIHSFVRLPSKIELEREICGMEVAP